MRRVLLSLLLLAVVPVASAQRPALTVETIMQDPDTYVGASPRPAGWSETGDAFYFYWNPGGAAPSDSLYRMRRGRTDYEKVPTAERRAGVELFDGWHHGEHVYTSDWTKKAFSRDGDLFVLDRPTGKETRLTQTRAREGDVRFTPDGTGLVFQNDGQLYRHDLSTGARVQLTDLRDGSERQDPKPSDQQAYLEAQQQALFGYLREQKAERDAREEAQQADQRALDAPPTFYTGSKNIGQLEIDPRERFVTFTLTARADDKGTEVPSWITDDGYTGTLRSRPKVGGESSTTDLYVQDLARDTTYKIDLYALPGTYDVPAYRLAMGIAVDSSKTKRSLRVVGPRWSGDAKYALLDVRADDNKTRWIARLDPASGALTALDVQQDDAWIGGPGVGWFGTFGWMPDNRHFYFQSEKTGYSHLYVGDAETGAIRAVTSGAFEVSDVFLTKDGNTFYFTSTEASPYERHLYRVGADGGTRTRITTEPGHHDATFDPRGELLVTTFSTANRPPDLYVQALAPNRDRTRLTTSTHDAWLAYPWRDAEIIQVPASDGAQVPARIYRPETPNGAAVLFVHGAGYLHNVHRGWSSYFREYMFHNLLADQGYTVLDLDYRASAGYGRDWRTGVYRYMGGRDLQDYVDASDYVGTEFGIDPERVFIYGGSYGGFITLMALFTEPEHFGGGAALRSVTDWAHYNHGYTANILNTPALDTLAYRQSSPIYHAEGYEGDPLLIAHGMVDTNVEFQDVVRLAQRLIELGKEGWEMAVYPVENHGFTEPASWTDEYKRILRYIEMSVGPERTPQDR